MNRRTEYKMPEGGKPPFFTEEPEDCPEARPMAIVVVSTAAQGKDVEVAAHERLWEHVRNCAVCLRNTVKFSSRMLGNCPLPVQVKKVDIARATAPKFTRARVARESN